MVTEVAFDPLGSSVVVLGVVGYAAGVRRLADRGRAWPVGRSAAFAAALVAFSVATLSGLAAYDTVQFSAHMAQHLLLGMIVPVLLVVARPVTLILQAGSRATQVTTLRVLHHPVVAFLTEPIVAFVAFVSTLWLLYFTPLYDLSTRNDAVHLGLHVHFVVVGVLFYGACWPPTLARMRRRRPLGSAWPSWRCRPTPSSASPCWPGRRSSVPPPTSSVADRGREMPWPTSAWRPASSCRWARSSAGGGPGHRLVVDGHRRPRR